MNARKNARAFGGDTGETGTPITPPVDPGQTLDTAMALTLQPGVPLVVQDQVGGQDAADVYSFELTAGQPINITLDGPQGDVDLYLLDAEGNVVAYSEGEGIVLENIAGELAAGTYYVAVLPWQDANTPYSLSIQAGGSTAPGPVEPIHPAVDPGQTLDTAMALPLQPGVPLVVQDQVGGQDAADVYSFELTEGQPINITLDGSQGDVDLYLLDGQGNVLAYSEGEGIVLENISGEVPAGTYYVAVLPWQDANTPYSLTIQAGASSGGDGVIRPEVDPGDTMDTAMVLPVPANASLTVQDAVGAQDPVDAYRIDLAEDQAVSIALQGAAGDVDLQLYDAQGNLMAESVNGGLEVDSLEGGLAAGSYYVVVASYDGAQTDYALSIEASAAGGGIGAAAPCAMPESLALRDQTGLGSGGAASNPFGQARDETLAGQLLAAA